MNESGPKKEDGSKKIDRRSILTGLLAGSAAVAAGAYMLSRDKSTDTPGDMAKNKSAEHLPRIEEMPPQKIKGMKTILETQLRHGNKVSFSRVEDNLLSAAWEMQMHTRTYINELVAANTRLRTGIDDTSATTYLEQIKKEFVAERVPVELGYLTVPETGFRLKDKNGGPVTSPAKAVGPYQFTLKT